jgi:putative ABC transport system substrate-binding protein
MSAYNYYFEGRIGRIGRRELMLALAGALTAPRAMHAQQKATPVVGFLNGNAADTYAPYVAAFRRGLGETGYVEGQNLAIEYRWAEGHYDRLPALAADLIGRKVDVIAATGGASSSLAAKKITSTIPIVFTGGFDPVATGLVASLARPGGNLTGVSILTYELMPKRLELLSELAPEAKVIALLVNPNNSQTEALIKDMRQAANVRGVQLPIVKAGAEVDFEGAFAALAQLHADALVVSSDPYFNARREPLVMLAARHAVPAIYEWREFVQAGGLASYGTSLTDMYRQVGNYAGKILKGEKPADLPVQQPTKFELVLNLKTAKALGLTISPALLDLADEAIE